MSGGWFAFVPRIDDRLKNSALKLHAHFIFFSYLSSTVKQISGYWRAVIKKIPWGQEDYVVCFEKIVCGPGYAGCCWGCVRMGL